MRQMSPVCKMADNGRLITDQNVKVVLFYAETRSVIATQRHFVRGCAEKRCSHWIGSSLGTILQPLRINSVPDVKCFYKNKNVLCYNQWYDISCSILYMLSKVRITFLISFKYRNKVLDFFNARFMCRKLLIKGQGCGLTTNIISAENLSSRFQYILSRIFDKRGRHHNSPLPQ